jgi:hypothetical protein
MIVPFRRLSQRISSEAGNCEGKSTNGGNELGRKAIPVEGRIGARIDGLSVLFKRGFWWGLETSSFAGALNGDFRVSVMCPELSVMCPSEGLE